MNHEQFSPAPLHKRLLAFLLDALIASIPAMILTYIFTEGIKILLFFLYPAPILGTTSIITLPLEANAYMNSLVPSGSFAATELRNVSMIATLARVGSVIAVLFYVAYSAVATIFYDGQTLGKYVFKLTVVRRNEGSFKTAAILREVLGKIVLNSTIIIPIISMITMLVTKNHLAIHDFIGQTRVISDQRITGSSLLDSYDEDEEE